MWPKRDPLEAKLCTVITGYMVQSVAKLNLTHISPSRLDDDGSAAPGFLLGLSHALPGFLVGVICGAHRDFVLDPSQAVQLYAPFTKKKDQTRHSNSRRVCRHLPH